ncbi:MAG: MurT ligase domain-containing protein [Actinomycetes bacterium]
MPHRGLKRAVLIALVSGWASRTFARKSGETISGRVLLALRPTAISELAPGRTIFLVSGTNGKTSTTRFLKRIVEQKGSVATSQSGSNLNWGIASSLMKPDEYAVLEIDELHLPSVLAQTNPKVVVLLNLTRDQLHRMHEVKRVADKWHEIADVADETTFVVDIDDPYVNYATSTAKSVIRVSFGGRSHPDGAVCPKCGSYLTWKEGVYDSDCGLTNRVYDRLLVAADASARNAALANIAGSLIAAPYLEPSLGELERTIVREVRGVHADIRLTKNPASWTEALRGVTSQNVILILNSREVDGIDTSWLFDVSFEILQGRKIVVTGERALDIQYRLHVEGITSVHASDFDSAMGYFRTGDQVQVLSAYTAFFELSK